MIKPTTAIVLGLMLAVPAWTFPSATAAPVEIACSLHDKSPQPPSPSQKTEDQSSATQQTIVGQLSPTVEPGGWTVSTEGQKFLLLGMDTTPYSTWYEQKTPVQVTGHPRPDLPTTFMEGIPFQVKSITPAP